MSFLLDTDRVVDYLNGDQAAVELINALAVDQVGLSLVTYGEVYDGIIYGDSPDRTEEAFLRLLEVVEVIGLDEAIMRRFARIRGDLRNRGLKIGDTDIMIAATAIHYGLTLVTRNRRHFERIPDLTLYEPA